MTDLTVAETILEQLGGKTFIMMTGAKNLSGGPRHLSFGLPRNPKKVSHVTITYDTGSDSYSVKFMSVRGIKVKDLASFEGVYCYMLQDLLTQETGLHTKL